VLPRGSAFLLVPLGRFIRDMCDSIFGYHALAVAQMLGEEREMLAVDIARVIGNFFAAIRLSFVAARVEAPYGSRGGVGSDKGGVGLGEQAHMDVGANTFARGWSHP